MSERRTAAEQAEELHALGPMLTRKIITAALKSHEDELAAKDAEIARLRQKLRALVERIEATPFGQVACDWPELVAAKEEVP